NVCFGSLADILDGLSDVRFTSESGRRSADWVRFVIRTWQSSTSRRGCFAVLFWRLKHSRSGGELPPGGSASQVLPPRKTPPVGPEPPPMRFSIYLIFQRKPGSFCILYNHYM